MNRIARNSHLFSNFTKFTQKQRNFIKKTLTKDQVIFIIELVTTVLTNRNILKPKIVKKLEKLKHKLREIASCKCTFKKKKKIIQSGSFLNVILSTLAGSAISHFLEKYNN